MTTIVSKRHILKFYVLITFIVLFFTGIATGTLYTYCQLAGESALRTKDHLMILFSAACYFFAGYILYVYLKHAPKITINQECIRFNRQNFLIADIENISLTGKVPFRAPTSVSLEAVTLKFKNGVTKYIFDDFYSNAWEMKLFLKQIATNKAALVRTDSVAIDQERFLADFYETFKGNQLTSFRGISLWVIVGECIYFAISARRPLPAALAIFLCGISTIIFFLFSYQMFYFQLSDNYLLVRNHNFFWLKNAYPLSDIKEVVFETQAKMPNSLRVITKDYRSKLYRAGTLRDKTWLALKDKLETYNIEVRNECITQQYTMSFRIKKSKKE